MTTSTLQSIKADFFNHLRPGVSAYTLETYQWQLEVFLKWLSTHNIKTVTTQIIADWMTDMSCVQNLSHQTSRLYLKVVERLLDYAVLKGLAQINPVQRKLLPKLKHKASRPRGVFTPDEVRLVLATCLAKGDVEWHHFITVGQHTGLRLGDVAHLRWDAIDWAEETLKIRPAKTIRLGKQVIIPMAADLIDVLRARQAQPDDRFSDMADYVFPAMAREYDVIGHNNLKNKFFYRCHRVKVEGKGFHTLRHTFVSRLANKDVNYGIIASMTGQTAKIIAGYHHVSLAAQRKALL